MKAFKINVVPVVLAFVLSALAAYAFYAYADCKEQALVLAVGSFIMLMGTLFGLMGFSYEHKRNLTMIRVVSLVFFLISLVSNIIFSSVGFAVPAYVIVNGFIVLICFMTAYFIARSAESQSV